MLSDAFSEASSSAKLFTCFMRMTFSRWQIADEDSAHVRSSGSRSQQFSSSVLSISLCQVRDHVYMYLWKNRCTCLYFWSATVWSYVDKPNKSGTGIKGYPACLWHSEINRTQNSMHVDWTNVLAGVIMIRLLGIRSVYDRGLAELCITAKQAKFIVIVL